MKTIQNKPFEEKQSTELAIGTFTISTLLFMLYIVSNESPNILVIAWPFALSGIVLNSIMLFHLTERFIHLPAHRRDIAVKILIILSNIPITFLYYLAVMKS
ncbi:hypothetical protein L1276_000865 [Flavobacterium sp. HSC-32F16]|uniref:hypothetical protein n=1 Tax=Flavobacterium sp. HSC-32F16 TaxID=2910964 RepID=UPI0020A283BC|nr:hypothetical protein [Flavobacterium sp. HSC-32F16]MCP2025725.1 hypothetical protein [Flavobacterium sp. HSC-32F16]